GTETAVSGTWRPGQSKPTTPCPQPDSHDRRTHMTSRNDSSKTFDRFLIILAVMGALTVGLALVAALRAPAAPASSDTPPAESANTVTATIELSEWAIEGDLTIPAGDVTIELVNVGAMVHNLAFEDGKVF